LATHGWASVSLGDDDDPLLRSFNNLFAATARFFDLPQSEKERFALPGAGSEAGWSRVEGEKELMTLRMDTPRTLPDVLREPALECWRLCGAYLNDLLGAIAHTLGLPQEALTVFSEPCIELRPTRVATMLRLFRYEGDQEAKIVAEREPSRPLTRHFYFTSCLVFQTAHHDLGLLSLVIGDTPGLQVWDRERNVWHPIEETYTKPTASVLTGLQLACLTNNRYLPGPHRVVSTPLSASRYRYSIVFILRAHSPVPIDTSALTTPFTGPFQRPMRGMKAGDLFNEILKGCFNINVSKEVRDEQKVRLGYKTPGCANS
jgi:isopenicillin N synthase-like dioxygenase